MIFVHYQTLYKFKLQVYYIHYYEYEDQER